MSQKEDAGVKRYKRDLIALGLVAVLFVMQFFVIRFGIFGEGRPDPDEMSYKEKIKYAQKHDLVPERKKAEDVMTREELAFALYGLAEPEDDDEAYEDEYGTSFEDLDEAGCSGNEKKAVYWCVLNKLMYPPEKGSFDPEAEVSAQDLVVTMMRLLKFEKVTLPDPEEEPPELSDESKAYDYAKNDITDMRSAGLLSGVGVELAPKKAVTYENAADIIIRVKNAMDDDEERAGKEYKPIPDLFGLEKDFKDTTKKFEGNWSMYIRCFDTGQTLVVNETQMVSASLIKLFVAGAYFDGIKDGKLEETVNSKDDLDLMISESSNTSWVDLEVFIGGSEQAGIDKVNKFAKDNGYKHTARLSIPEGQSERANYTCVLDVGTVLDKLYKGTYVSAEASEVILGHMKDQVHVNKIPAGIPDKVEVANKTGELGTNEHDSAIVWAPNCTYALVIMSEDVNRAQIGYKQVAEVSKAVYEYMTK